MRWDREAIAISRSPYLAGASRVVKEVFSPGCCRVCRKDPVAADPERAPKVLTHDQV